MLPAEVSQHAGEKVQVERRKIGRPRRLLMVVGMLTQHHASHHPESEHHDACSPAGDQECKNEVEGQFVDQRPCRRDRKREVVQPDERESGNPLAEGFGNGGRGAEAHCDQKAEHPDIDPVHRKEPNETPRQIIAQAMRLSDVATMGEDDDEARQHEKEIDTEIAAPGVVREQLLTQIAGQSHHYRKMERDNRHRCKTSRLLQ